MKGTLKSLPVLLFLSTLALGACGSPGSGTAATTTPASGGIMDMPNPASAKCEEEGYQLDIRTGADGGQYGVCIFPDGSECEEWAFFRGECGPAGEVQAETGDILDMPNPASAHCEDQGYQLDIRTGADGGQYGVCIFDDGSECEEWAFFRGECGPAGGAGEKQPAPDEVRAVRDAVLLYLVENGGEETPGTGLVWTDVHTTPAGLLGAEQYRFTAGNWLMDISYPIVAPDAVVYSATLSNPVTGFQWQGEVDASGTVAPAAIR